VRIGLSAWEDLADTRARPIIEKALQQIYKMDPKTTQYIVDDMGVTDIALPWE